MARLQSAEMIYARLDHLERTWNGLVKVCNEYDKLPKMARECPDELAKLLDGTVVTLNIYKQHSLGYFNRNCGGGLK